MIEMNWFLPTGGDSRDVLPDENSVNRAPSHTYLAQIARACEDLGFDALLTPCGTGCEDAWLATASLIALTSRIKFLVAFRPALLTPTLAAQMASTFQRMSNGRCLVNIVTGAEQAELARFGVNEDKETRYERTGEFIEVMRGAWSGEPFTFSGKFFNVTDATTREAPNPIPPIYFGGASASAEKVAGENVDLYLSWGETPEAITERHERVAAIAAAQGRTLRFGIRFHTIARPTSDEAWSVANNILDSMAPDAIAAAREDFLKTQSVGQRRQFELHGGDLTKLEIHPNVWAGIGLVRGGVGTALVGSYEEVADRIEEYHKLGIEAFIMSGYPHLEEAYWFGEGVMPILRDRGLLPALEGGPTKVFSFR
jgi:alkanesulfonate monooxygenase